MAERIGVIANGQLVAEGTFEELRDRSGNQGSPLEVVFLDIVESGSSDDRLGSLAA